MTAVAQQPAAEAEEPWLNWIPPLKEVFPHLPNPTHNDPYEGLNEFAVNTRIVLDHGNVVGGRFPKDRDTGAYKTWTFRDVQTPGPGPHHVQALSGDLVLRVPNLRLFDGGTTDEITVRSTAGWALSLKPRSRTRTLVQASITNLPTQDPPEKDFLEHMNMLKELTGWKVQHGNPKLPVVNGGLGVTSGNSFCPPLIYG